MWFSFANKMWAKVLKSFSVNVLKASDQFVTFSSACCDNDENMSPDGSPTVNTMRGATLLIHVRQVVEDVNLSVV